MIASPPTMTRPWILLCAGLLLAGCGASSPTAASGDAAVSDVPASGDVSAASDVPAASDAPAAGDAPAASDAPAVTRGHSSYVPPTLRPTAAERLIVLGDSISTGTGASNRNTTSYYGLLSRNDARWPGGVGVDLETRFGHAVPVVNVAVGGATSTTMRATQLDALRARLSLPVRGHSVVVITIGGNDLQTAIVTGNPEGPPLTTAIANLRTVVGFLQDPANFPDGASVYVGAVYDPSDGEGQIQGCFFNLRLPTFVTALDTWRARYVALGTEMGFAVVDALGHFHGHAHHNDNAENPYYDAADPSRWFSDCIHPNDRGHHELRRLFFQAIDARAALP